MNMEFIGIFTWTEHFSLIYVPSPNVAEHVMYAAPPETPLIVPFEQVAMLLSDVLHSNLENY